MNEEDHVAKLFEGPVRANVERVVATHLDNSPGAPHRLTHVLLDRAFLQKWPVYDQPKDLEALDRLGAAVSEIERLYYFGLTWAASDTLGARMVHGPYYDGLHNGSITRIDSDEFRDLSAYHKDTGQKVASTLSAVEEFSNAICEAIAHTKDEIVASERARKSTSRMNLIGIQLVEAARFVWKLVKDKEAPAKDLNMASAFGAFLADVFEACEVQGDVRSAFRAWAKETALVR
jgi:hypothetical protein